MIEVACERILAGDLRRLMVFMPPRHGKSELLSRLFAGYFLYRYPERWVGIASYGADLAQGLSKAAREFYRSVGGPISRHSSAGHHWMTGLGGGMWAAGVGGPATGKGFHLGIIDDPLKDAEEAASATIREKQKEWFDSTFSTREEPEGGALVVIQTRWHEDDLAGWLLSREEKLDDPEAWEILWLPAIAEPAPEFPASCNVWPDWREPGEPLCPERYALKRLEKIRAKSSYYWSALYQGRPAAREGNFFKRAWFGEIVPAAPAEAHRVRFWDKAATDGGGDWTAGVLMAAHQGVYYVEDVVRGQWAPGERDQVMLQTAHLDRARAKELAGGDVRIGIEMEGGSAGKDAAATTTRAFSGFTITHHPASAAKEIRADPFASQAQAGNVKLVAGAWNRAYLDELCGFPAGTHDDQVDASSGAFHMLAVSPWWMDPQLKERIKAHNAARGAAAPAPAAAPAEDLPPEKPAEPGQPPRAGGWVESMRHGGGRPE